MNRRPEIAKQHGHSVQVMLDVYANWTDGAQESDVEAIKRAMQSAPSNGAIAQSVANH